MPRRAAPHRKQDLVVYEARSPPTLYCIITWCHRGTFVLRCSVGAILLSYYSSSRCYSLLEVIPQCIPVVFVGFRIIARVSEALPGRASFFPGLSGVFGIFRYFPGFSEIFRILRYISLYFGILRDFSARAAPVAGTHGPGHRPASESTARPGGAF